MADMLSQDEINALLGGDTKNTESIDTENGSSNDNDDSNTSEDNDTRKLTSEEIDIIGEVGNISMGTAATTLSALLKQKVTITTPDVKILTWDEIAKGYTRPCVGVQIDYTLGIQGKNVLLLERDDVRIITDLMMGGKGEVEKGLPLTELDLSAIGEAMNQMIGSASTSLASLTKIIIDIATPQAFNIDFTEDVFFDNLPTYKNEKVIATYFRMQVGDLIDSTMMQVIPMDFAFSLVNSLRVNITEEVKKIEEERNIPTTEPAKEVKVEKAQKAPAYVQEQRVQNNVNARPVQFQDFGDSPTFIQKENIGMLMDVPLEVAVELGKTSKTIEQILEFSPGTVIELDKLAGEPIDILVNGKYIAKGEVVVIDENFAIRITSIVSGELRF